MEAFKLVFEKSMVVVCVLGKIVLFPERRSFYDHCGQNEAGER
tara:strand:- start:38138 stop:38266 length:129 start_codon:yes stop_codon:yes gene_type:complete